MLFLLFAGKIAFAQASSDTAEMINEFRKVMSFSIQPYLFFRAIIKTNARPVIQQQDTLSLNGVFYKNQKDMYYSNGWEQVYLQDSFMIQINPERKSIWISKVDVMSKNRMNILPLSDNQLRDLIRKKYTIEKITSGDMISVLDFETKEKTAGPAIIATGIKLRYFVKDYLPVSMEVEMRMQQPLNGELLAELKNESINDTALVQIIGDTKYLVRRQSTSVAFSEINNTKAQAIKMPSWKEILDYQKATGEFTAKGVYKDYEVTKTF